MKRSGKAVALWRALAEDEAHELVTRVDRENLPPVLEGVEALDRCVLEEQVPQARAALVVVDGRGDDEAHATALADELPGALDEEFEGVGVAARVSSLRSSHS
ncbi:MAG: hypothetical protein KatS3mg076_1540 [Candidatus Binatia bacterium]|nr:MAG: hypothetical protein KatS3mg076_1540 [Candidatus Binatia bacterium]